MEEPKKCDKIHKINGTIPNPDDVQYDQKTCDCGRLLFVAEPCGCANKKLELKSKQNPNYIPQ